MRIAVEKCPKSMEGLHSFGAQLVIHNVRTGGVSGTESTYPPVGIFRIEIETRHPPVSYQPSQQQLLTRLHLFTSCYSFFFLHGASFSL